MNRPAPVTAGDPESAAHRPIREAIDQLCSGAGKLEDVESAIAEVLHYDLHQAAALRALLDEAHSDRSLSKDDYRQLSAELQRLVTEEVPTDGIPHAPVRNLKPQPVARSAPLSAGTLLAGRYQLEECVAEGPLSDVYRAGDRWRAELGAGNASVAVKVLAPADDGIIDRDKLRRQALWAQELAHPNVCRVLAVERDGDTDFVVTEWLEGESLASLMDRCHAQPLDPALLRAVVEATAAALEHALEHGLVHGDLKPANVFVCDDGSVKLLDFGLARGEPAAPAMTPEYASCEILEGRAPEPADDIYAFGVMAYRALTGSRPFGRRSALEAEADDARAERVLELDVEQWASMTGALAFRRADRDISAARLGARLARSPAPASAQTHAPAKRVQAWQLVAVLAVLAGGIALVATDWLRSGDRPPPVVQSPDVEPREPSMSVDSAPADAVVPTASGIGTESSAPDQATAAQAAREDLAEPANSLLVDPAAVAPAPTASDSLPGGLGGLDPAPLEWGTSSAELVPEPAPEPPVQAPPAPPATTTEPAAVPAAPPVPGGRLGFRDGLYEADEADGFVKLRLRAPARHPGIRLRLSAGAGSAEFGTDFALAEQIIEIEPGSTRVEVLWPLVDDARDEYLEEVELLLESLTDDYPVTGTDALVIIFDDDGPEPETADVSLL